MVWNAVDNDSCTSYEVAVAEVPQLKLREIGRFCALLVGKARIGAAGGAITVVKLQIFDQVVPLAFEALACQ